MYKYECSYCGDPLCPELCPEAKAAHKRWVESDEFKSLIENRCTNHHTLVDRTGKEITVGCEIIHTSFPRQKIKVYEKDDELYAGFVKVNSYHSSVLEVVDEH
ncbi:hypothetical protein 2018Mat002_0945 [Vibrio phage ICP1]|nr:hypothetical protein 2018Mat002_0945 [Vibrio phage ICP1]QVW08042.1 hypothetical protein 2019MatB_0945 [Vibrio phage ICP1]QVW08493.1 hypothetical protein 2019MatD_0945 [Vibrio phage ICP1]QVW08717.1 hypothetical protein 2019MatE_0955 [Vibrio phage ICP1]